MMFKKCCLIASLSLCASMSFAADCSFDLKGTDKMTYTNKDGNAVPKIEVPASCKTFKINLEHVGKSPITGMGHNVVITKASDVAAVAKDWAKSKDTGYVKAGDARVVAYSKMIGGKASGAKETTSVEFPVAKIKAGGYKFFCSFPAHSGRMNGDLVVK